MLLSLRSLAQFFVTPDLKHDTPEDMPLLQPFVSLVRFFERSDGSDVNAQPRRIHRVIHPLELPRIRLGVIRNALHLRRTFWLRLYPVRMRDAPAGSTNFSKRWSESPPASASTASIPFGANARTCSTAS